VITVHGSQKEARNIEKAIYKSFQNINSMDSMQEEVCQPRDMPRGKIDLADQEETKCVPLDEAVPDRKVTIASTFSRGGARITQRAIEEPRHLRLECLRPIGSQQRYYTTFTGHQPKYEAKEAKTEEDV